MGRTNFNVMIIEGQTILREALTHLLEGSESMEVAGAVSDAKAAIEQLASKKPDVILTELCLPRTDGVAAINALREIDPRARILVLSTQRSRDFILAAFRAGATGYLVKDSTTAAELFSALEAVYMGRKYVSHEISGTLISELVAPAIASTSPSIFETLTERERQVMKLVAEGMRNKDIAKYLHLSVRTVENHRAHLKKKLKLTTASSLVALAVETGLVNC